MLQGSFDVTPGASGRGDAAGTDGSILFNMQLFNYELKVARDKSTQDMWIGQLRREPNVKPNTMPIGVFELYKALQEKQISEMEAMKIAQLSFVSTANEVVEKCTTKSQKTE